METYQHRWEKYEILTSLSANINEPCLNARSENKEPFSDSIAAQNILINTSTDSGKILAFHCWDSRKFCLDNLIIAENLYTGARILEYD